jgi:two-component system CheB/CheR fusion protein
MLILGPDLRIRRFTPLAEALFNLIPTDVGRPVTDINVLAQVPHFGKLVGEVLDTLATKEIEVRCNDSRWYSLRIRPYKTSDHRIDGVVIAVVDIDAIKDRMNRSDRARVFAEAIVNTVRQPLVVLNNRLTVRHVNETFLRVFGVTAVETLNQRIYDLGNGQWNIPKLRTLLEEILPNNSTLHDFEVEHNFPRIGKKRMILNAHRLSFKNEPEQLIVLAIEEVNPRKRGN